MFSRVRPPAIAAGLVAAAMAAMAARAIHSQAPAVDFSAIWLAGKIWNAGADPYSMAFTGYADRLFPPPAHHPLSWVYPAQWMLPARLFALTDFAHAKAVWFALSVTALGVSLALLWRAAAHLTKPPSAPMKTAAILFLLSMEATGASLYLGQTTFLILLGFALVLHGLATARPPAATIGLLLLFLKPQFGIVFAAAALAVRPLRVPLLVAAALTGLACLAGFAMSPLGVWDSVSAWLRALGRYGDEPYNVPAALTGLNLIASGVVGLTLSPFTYTGLATVAAPVAMRWLNRDAALPTLEAFWLSSVGALTIIAPLHVYDFSIAASLLFLLPIFARPQQVCLIGGMVLLHRARTIGGMLAPGADILHSQAAVATLGDVLIVAAMLMFGVTRGRARAHAT